jgi:hypothetical protein
MKVNYIFLKVFVCLIFSTGMMFSQTTITQWNFNGTSAATVPGGTSSPSTVIGSGSAELVGGTTATFASGISSGGSSDPVITSPDNYGWNTSTYAALGAESKLRGVQFNVSTVGYQGMSFRFDQRLSNTANNTYVVQYTLDRTAGVPVWTDAQTFTFTPAPTLTGDVWYNLRTVDLSAVTGLDNNANAAFRIVSAFDPVAGNYLSATSTSVYGTAGTVRFDMVTIIAATVLGVDGFENNQNRFSFYPNPVENNVIYFSDFTSVHLFDVMGKNVMNAKEVKQLNIENLNAGLYFIKNDNGNVIKMIKN